MGCDWFHHSEAEQAGASRLRDIRRTDVINNARLFPLSPFAALRSVDRLFHAIDPFQGGAPVGAPAFPAVNVWEDGDSVFVEAELPGMKMENLELLVVDDELTIKGRRPAADDPKVMWHRHERGPEIHRVMALPYRGAQPGLRRLKDGVLSVVLPKVKPRARKIKSGGLGLNGISNREDSKHGSANHRKTETRNQTRAVSAVSDCTAGRLSKRGRVRAPRSVQARGPKTSANYERRAHDSREPCRRRPLTALAAAKYDVGDFHRCFGSARNDASRIAARIQTA